MSVTLISGKYSDILRFVYFPAKKALKNSNTGNLQVTFENFKDNVSICFGNMLAMSSKTIGNISLSDVIDKFRRFSSPITDKKANYGQLSICMLCGLCFGVTTVPHLKMQPTKWMCSQFHNELVLSRACVL